MALEDLIIDQKDVATDLVESVLKDRVELVKNTRGVHLTKQGQTLSNRTRILLFLCSKKAWDLIENKQEPTLTSLEELAQGIDLFGSTLRTASKALKDSHFVNSDKGKYFIMTSGVHALENWLKEESSRKPSRTIGGVRTKNRTKGQKVGRPDFLQKFSETPPDEAYVTKIMPILIHAKGTDKYLLAIYTAKEQMGLDGLIPSEVKYLLTEPPFNLPSKTMHNSNISRDLSKLRNYVNPYKAGGAFEYRLNRPGYEYVQNLLNPQQGTTELQKRQTN